MGTSETVSRTSRYMARIAEHLPTLPSDRARHNFIEGQLARFEESFAAFVRAVDRGEDPGEMTAWDYSETLSALRIELSKYSEFREVTERLNAANTELEGRLAELGRWLHQ